MGMVSHNAVLVTVELKEKIRKLRKWIRETKAPIIESPTVINNTVTFVMYPDGSKEGWAESEVGDKARDAFVAWLEGEKYEDGSNSFCYVEISYGEFGSKVVRTNQRNQYA